MARNIERYGYSPNRTSDTPAVMLIEATRKLRERWTKRQRTPERQAAAQSPLAHGERCTYYYRTNHGYVLTPRQVRRMRHKSKVGAVAYAAGVRA